MSTIFYAKPDQTYKEHLEAVYVAWKETVAAKKSLIERLADRYCFPVDRFLQGSLLTVVLHDIGKMIEPFQQMMKFRRKGEKLDYRRNYRHELASFVFVATTWSLLNRSTSNIPLEALAVVGHHKLLDTDLESFEREGLADSPRFLPDGVKEAIKEAEKLFCREGWMFPKLPDGLEKKDPYRSLSRLIGWNGVFGKLLEKENVERVRILYAFFKGILHYADWYGSGKEKVNYQVKESPKVIEEDLKRRCQEKKIPFSGLRPFQKMAGDHSGHLIAIAPTGSGKTEASLLWAINNVNQMGGAKIIYLLPTMVTANNIWQRLCNIFGKENVGLTHSTANLFLEDEETDIWEDSRQVLFGRTFIQPVTVGTVDQLLTIGFNAGQWVVKEINAANAVIILDEIHAYDAWTLGLIVSSIRHFAGLGARFLLMSATLPSSLIRLFQQELKMGKVFREETMLAEKRSRYFVEDQQIEEITSKIEEAVEDDRRVLLVVNTVNRCQELAKQFSYLGPICYHSHFILKDRKYIEEKIEKAQFVIATQVVEVSLDIDFDWLFTECAPPDAIAQRAGRVNRYRDPKRDSRVYLFKASQKSGKIYNPINDPDLLNRSFEVFRGAPEEMSEQDLINVVEKVYQEYQIENSEVYQEAIVQYQETQKKRMAIFDNRIREDKQEVTRQARYEAISVIPVCFKEEALGLKPAERQWYEVKLPLWYVLKNKEEERGILFCNIEYDSQFGARLSQDDSPTISII